MLKFKTGKLLLGIMFIFFLIPKAFCVLAKIEDISIEQLDIRKESLVSLPKTFTSWENWIKSNQIYDSKITILITFIFEEERDQYSITSVYKYEIDNSEGN